MITNGLNSNYGMSFIVAIGLATIVGSASADVEVQMLSDGEDYGTALSVSDTHLAVGAPASDVSRVYLYGRQGNMWTETAVLEKEAGGGGIGGGLADLHQFGAAVDLEGDTLVVESNGYNEKTWLHAWGLEHSENLRVTERYRRLDFGHIEIEVIFDDPETFDEPLRTVVEMVYAADDVILEIVCDEATEGGVKHWVGDKLSDARASAIELETDILNNYVGTYEGIWLEYLTTVKVTLEGDALFLSRNGEEKAELIPQSDNSFICATCTWSQPYIFNNDGDGMAMSVQEVQVSGRWIFDRVE